MVKKTVEPPPILDWNPKCKEPWLMDFEKQPINDERWSCSVTAAIQAEAEAEECLQIFTQCAATGLRKAVRIITLSDVNTILKEATQKSQTSKSSQTIKKENKNPQKEKLKRMPSSSERSKSTLRFSAGTPKIVELAAKYASQVDSELRLPPDLMAGLLKYIILNLKEENIAQKKIAIAERKRERSKNIEAKFIQNLKPFEIREQKTPQKKSLNILGLPDVIKDEPYGGPDLYIVLIDFYDPLYFSELIRINVPFVALLKIVHFREPVKWSYISVPEKPEPVSKKADQVSQFWKTLKESSFPVEKAHKFKEVAMMQYQTPFFRPTEAKQHIHRTIFDELSWMQYSAYRVYRHHQNYLKELYVQRNFLSLEPLDLSKCGVYNSLCDALVTGEASHAPWLVLYAIIEQVVAGLPHKESVPLEYQPQIRDFFAVESETEASSKEDVVHEEKNNVILVTPCKECRGKKYDPMEICNYLKDLKETASEKDEWSDVTKKKETPSDVTSESVRPESASGDTTIRSEYALSETLIASILQETESQKQTKKWKPPKLCFYGDFINIETYYCDSRLLNSSTIIERFFKNSGIIQVWTKYPVLPPEGRAYYNYHFQTLLNVSKENQDVLKVKIFLTIFLKMIGVTKSHLYKGEEDIMSEIFPPIGREKLKKLSKVRFEQKVIAPPIRPDGRNFSNYFFKTFLENRRGSRRSTKIISGKSSMMKDDSHNLRKITSQFNMYLDANRSSRMCFSHCLKSSEGSDAPFFGPVLDKNFSALNIALDCSEISCIIEPHLMHDKCEHVNLIDGFKFFERLEAERMIQALLDAQINYNTVQCSYFAPTDTLLIVMHNDFDYRGIFYACGVGALHTPVGLKDFYNFVYPEILEWLLSEEAKHEKMINSLLDIEKEKEKEQDERFLADLTEQYYKMSEEERAEYLQSEGRYAMGVDIKDIDLPVKPKPPLRDRISFVGTNFRDIRVETQSHIHEYYSKDGTEVSTYLEAWLYNPLKLLSLAVKKGSLSLTHYQWVGSPETNENFILKTNSDIIVSFFKEGIDYQLEISWPIGLLIQKMAPEGCSMYIKQSYLPVYRKNWDIKDELSRCVLPNGQVIAFKENGSIEVLFGSGTRCTMDEVQKQTKKQPRVEITNSIGEVWESLDSEHCHKKKLITHLKIYIGVDPDTEEVFYKREDGVCCMLWPGGKLVTKFPDGTKITSVPSFDDEEVTTEWSEEENVEEESREDLSDTETYVSVSCTYLIEHPNYAGVYFTADSVQLNMFENLTIKYENNVYELKKDSHVLSVQNDVIEFYTECPNCENRSIAVVTPSKSDVLCKFEDFANKVFCVLKDGSTTFEDNNKNCDDTSECEVKNGSTYKAPNNCNHIKSSFNQRCFALDRNLSGYEFIHSNALAEYCNTLPDNAYYELDSKSSDNSVISHMFSTSYSKIGYENWVMKYSSNDSLPTNLKRVDLREQKQKVSQRKLSVKKYSPGDVSSHPRSHTEAVDMPKLVVTRIVKCLGQKPGTVVDDLQKFVYAYQERARKIIDKYRSSKLVDDRTEDPRYVRMRLRKIALTLCQSLNQYPHLCSQLPSTEKEIHYFGHFIKAADEYKTHYKKDDLLPDCKQIPRSLPEVGNFGAIAEENESSAAARDVSEI